jgi:hypothetical protein
VISFSDRVHFISLAIHTWKNVLGRLCTFIDTQLHRSPRDHTREMHSTCVAAYNTLVTLIIERPTLLEDSESLYRLCEIIELGVSGEKAQVVPRHLSPCDRSSSLLHNLDIRKTYLQEGENHWPCCLSTRGGSS